ncbi:thioredoxin domain-containing protein [Tenacibaculum sp. UWU-22]|uniref:thioredoxin domain-containing protein n=1 Tax=Tenacibaculum sp. UWU-22 TaxID=3234187 RepID=UPI0034DAE15B
MQNYTNDLIHETSPYLLQHAHNPVHWKPWNKTTLALAKKENKLLLISVGYSACHWCHVMEHESFEDTAVAAIMNKNFISIKVDREERPDVDGVYMEAVQLITGQGGWPLNVIALPDGRPVWGGTYFTKTAWTNALQKIAELYQKKPQKIEEYAIHLSQGIQGANQIQKNNNVKQFTKQHLDQAVLTWQKKIDFEFGGTHRPPKFPLPNNYEFLWRYAVQTNNVEMLNYVNTTLTKMALGGIFDQIGGGFSRYSVDKKWHIPHFEKMLYDNGQLVSLYSNVYSATKNILYKETVENILQFVERELTTTEGAFYAALDADSKNEHNHLKEGAFYVWHITTLKACLKDEFNLFSKYYNVNDYGYWENDMYHLIRKVTDATFAAQEKISEKKLREKVKLWKDILFKERLKRKPPRLDDKVLTSWNALMLKGYIDAYRVFNNSQYLEIALKNATFIKQKMLQKEGNLLHTYKNGKSTINAYLEDYATTIDAFISLYEVTLDESWLTTAKKLVEYVYQYFFDKNSGLFFFTSSIDDALITRKIDVDDNVIPSSNSIMARNLFKLSHYYANQEYLATAQQMLHTVKPNISLYPSAYSNWLQLEADLVGTYYEIAISGKDALTKTKEINAHYLPNKLIAGSIKKSTIPLMKGREAGNKTLIYVCVNNTCQLPESNIDKALQFINLKL